MRILRGSVAALFLVASSAHAADKEIEDFLITGTTLEVRWAGATVRAPGAMWLWSRLEGVKAAKLEAFQCVNRMNERDMFLAFLVTRQPVKPLNAGEMDDFIREVRKSMPDDRWVIARPQYERSDIPWPGSYRFRYELTSADATAYLYGYVGRKTRGYLTECVTLSPQEPAEFVQFSRSVFVREEKRNPSGPILKALVIAVAAIGIIQWLRSRDR
ncbi:MAG: hypothetical protein NEA02_10165 [Thermoanaerobaculia bacterium]|nr:hypothetical protein [Thermoanaerobaculia bacterium]